VTDLREGMRLSELNHERYWLPRLPNTLGWLRSEMFDVEEAMRLNREGSAIASEMHFPEGDANSRINLAFNHLALGEPDNALAHLSAAAALLAQDEWFRWVYTIRLHAGYAELAAKGGSAAGCCIGDGIPGACRVNTPEKTRGVGMQTARRCCKHAGPSIGSCPAL
jgi:hypothetical protein